MRLLLPNNWMTAMVPFINQDNDFTLVGSMTQLGRLENPDWSKTTLYNWDHYDFINYSRKDWVAFHEACKKAREVWMPTQAHADKYEAFSGVKAHVLNLAYVMPEEWDLSKNTEGDYAMMSSRPDGYKRFDWFERACEELGIPFKSTHPGTWPRGEFVEALRGCRVYVQASLDESLGGLTLMEAVYNEKPVLMSDSIKGGVEIYGDTINYFKWDDFQNFKRKLWRLWDTPLVNPRAKLRIAAQTPKGVAEMVNDRICTLKSQST
jgi:glycosyltransferase involved in cell wall biosynthesis